MNVLAKKGPISPPGDDELLAQIAAGDQQAFRELMERYTRRMLALAERTTGSAAEADEIVQESFVRVWMTAPDWRPDGAARFSSWLYRVVLNLSLDRRRRRRPLLCIADEEEPADTSPGGYESALAHQRHDVVVAAMQNLPYRQKAALSLHYFSELTAPEVAEILKVSLSALESLLFRGRKALRKSLTRNGIIGLNDVL